MNLHTDSNALALKLQSRDATREPTWVRYTLITIALIFFLSCLLFWFLLKHLNKALKSMFKL
ncbi:sulfate ABC transporter membrane protein [Acinetobacter baumannii]|nr:sulfate ABC transporter membrane protein [Acinetobacter baumannii]